MTVLSGSTVGPGREFELRTGASRGGGRIYEVDPEVVANFKAKLAEQTPARKPRRNGRVDAAVQKRIEAIVARAKANSAPVEIDEPEEVCIPVAETVKWTDEMVQALHGRYMAGESIKALGAEGVMEADACLLFDVCQALRLSKGETQHILGVSYLLVIEAPVGLEVDDECG